jgi:hypothetical protein
MTAPTVFCQQRNVLDTCKALDSMRYSMRYSRTTVTRLSIKVLSHEVQSNHGGAPRGNFLLLATQKGHDIRSRDWLDLMSITLAPQRREHALDSVYLLSKERRIVSKLHSTRAQQSSFHLLAPQKGQDFHFMRVTSAAQKREHALDSIYLLSEERRVVSKLNSTRAQRSSFLLLDPQKGQNFRWTRLDSIDAPSFGCGKELGYRTAFTCFQRRTARVLTACHALQDSRFTESTFEMMASPHCNPFEPFAVCYCQSIERIDLRI